MNVFSLTMFIIFVTTLTLNKKLSDNYKHFINILWIVLFTILIIKYKLSKWNLECNHDYILLYVVIIFPLILGQLKHIRNLKAKIWIISHY